MKQKLKSMMVLAGLGVLAGCATSDSLSQVDRNGSGDVSFGEFDSYMKNEIFTRVDSNGDGKVSQEEWRAVNPKGSISGFRRVDRNGDGMISRKEADADFDRELSLRKLFDKMDTNDDGKLSKDEIKVFQAKMKQAQGNNQLEKISNAASS